jgi:hypothetical protein
VHGKDVTTPSVGRHALVLAEYWMLVPSGRVPDELILSIVMDGARRETSRSDLSVEAL